MPARRGLHERTVPRKGRATGRSMRSESRGSLGYASWSMDDDALLARAEAALTEIKFAQGLSPEHASVLAALRIRLKGVADKSLEEMLESAGDLGGPGDLPAPKPKRSLDDALTQSEKKSSLDDILTQPEKPKPEWPG